MRGGGDFSLNPRPCPLTAAASPLPSPPPAAATTTPATTTPATTTPRAPTATREAFFWRWLMGGWMGGDGGVMVAAAAAVLLLLLGAVKGVLLGCTGLPPGLGLRMPPFARLPARMPARPPACLSPPLPPPLFLSPLRSGNSNVGEGNTGFANVGQVRERASGQLHGALPDLCLGAAGEPASPDLARTPPLTQPSPLLLLAGQHVSVDVLHARFVWGLAMLAMAARGPPPPKAFVFYLCRPSPLPLPTPPLPTPLPSPKTRGNANKGQVSRVVLGAGRRLLLFWGPGRLTILTPRQRSLTRRHSLLSLPPSSQGNVGNMNAGQVRGQKCMRDLAAACDCDPHMGGRAWRPTFIRAPL